MATGNPNNILYQFSMGGQGAGSGFGQGAWERAIAAGLTPSQIKAQMPSSGLTPGPWVEQQLALVGNAPNYTDSSLGGMAGGGSGGGSDGSQYQQMYQQQLDAAQSNFNSITSQYQGQLKSLTDDFTSRTKTYQDSLTEYQKKIADSQAKLSEGQLQADTLTRDRDKWKSDYEQLKSLNERQKALQEDLELNRLRSGATVSGSNATQGSLQSGNTVSRGDGSSGRLLIDRTKEAANSVLQRKVSDIVAPINSGGSYASGGSGGSTAGVTAGNRGGLANYYASRFGK